MFNTDAKHKTHCTGTCRSGNWATTLPSAPLPEQPLNSSRPLKISSLPAPLGDVRAWAWVRALVCHPSCRASCPESAPRVWLLPAGRKEKLPKPFPDTSSWAVGAAFTLQGHFLISVQHLSALSKPATSQNSFIWKGFFLHLTRRHSAMLALPAQLRNSSRSRAGAGSMAGQQHVSLAWHWLILCEILSKVHLKCIKTSKETGPPADSCVDRGIM